MKTILGILLASCVVTSAQAQTNSYWNHNGSIMELFAQGNNRAFVYVQPRPGMAELGVQNETVFEGQIRGGTYQGTAFVFSVCPPYKLGYQVSGPVSPDQLHVTLFGVRPIVDPYTCTIVDYRQDRLDFHYLGR